MNDNNVRKEKKFQSNKKYFTISIYAVITFCICLFIYKFTDNWTVTKSHFADITSMLAPFLIAFLIAYFIDPLVNRIDRILKRCFNDRFTKLHKILSLLLSYIIVVGFIILVLTFVIPQVISSISDLINQSATIYNNILTMFNQFSAQHPDLNLGAAQNFVQDSIPDLFEYVRQVMTDILPVLYNAGMSIISWLVNIILAFVISCYMMWGKQQLLTSIKRVIYAIFNEKNAERIIGTSKECNRIFSQFIIGKAIDSLIIGILCFIFMCILNLQYALIISLVVGITNMIPYFGPFIGAIPGVLLLLIIDPKQCFIFIILIFLLQQFDGAVLGPKILGSSTGLQPIWVIFAILAGNYVAGVLGMFLGVPVVAVIAYLLNNLIEYLLARKNKTPDLTDIPDDPVPHMSDEEIGFSYDTEKDKFPMHEQSEQVRPKRPKSLNH